MQEFWNTYYEQPQQNIPWQETQADWFKELVDKGTISGDSALDLGCGTGLKSIYLAKSGGFDTVTGVDISPIAIERAKENSVQAGMVHSCRFICRDVTSGDFIKEGETFDFILEWATIHTIPAEKVRDYSLLIEKWCRPGGKLLIRTFSSDSQKKFFFEELKDMRTKLSLYSKSQLLALFPEFRVVQENRSKPRTKPDYFFLECLLEKKRK